MYFEALPYAQDAALIIEDGNNVEYNSHYATIISKTQPVEKYNTQLEKFVREGKEDENIISILKSAYNSQKKDTTKFYSYLNDLKEDAKNSLVTQLKKQKINLKALPFNLKDTEGTIVQLNDYKGKTIILDFWSTWCIPCISSFPAMSKIVEQFKSDTSVVFLFINTFENEIDKFKLVKDFMLKNKYDFKVLVDTENKVAKLFEISIIPVKIIIGKDGKIKFKSIGFKGQDILKKELVNLISLAN
jgi:thiol-disulfide isomerase/thioredoxin